MTYEKKGDARRQTAGSERQGKDLAPGECDRVRNEEVHRDQDKPQPNCRASYNRAGPSAGIAAYASRCLRHGNLHVRTGIADRLQMRVAMRYSLSFRLRCPSVRSRSALRRMKPAASR